MLLKKENNILAFLQNRILFPSLLIINNKLNSQSLRIFGIICKSVETNGKSNNCHLFVEIDPDQPAIAIVDFINRYLIPYKQKIQNE